MYSDMPSGACIPKCERIFFALKFKSEFNFDTPEELIFFLSEIPLNKNLRGGPQENGYATA